MTFLYCLRISNIGIATSFNESSVSKPHTFEATDCLSLGFKIENHLIVSPKLRDY